MSPGDPPPVPGGALHLCGRCQGDVPASRVAAALHHVCVVTAAELSAAGDGVSIHRKRSVKPVRRVSGVFSWLPPTQGGAASPAQLTWTPPR